jgi:regulator of extracellular matrix RemA (YlzA/DUF370 family)
MASTSSPVPQDNLILTLPPELRNVIYAMVVTSDFYELDPTLSANRFPRARYGIYGIKRGIKAQGPIPAIAKTCHQVRAEVLDVYYGRNTFALVGDDSGIQAWQNEALASRVVAHDWMRLIGDDAKYLRKVRFLLNLASGYVVSILVCVVPDQNEDEPLVTITTSHLATAFLLETQSVQKAVQSYLAETGEMGEVWRAMVERALYPVEFDDSEELDFDITEEGIAIASAKTPLKRPKSLSKSYASSNKYQIKVVKPVARPSRQAKAPKQAAKPSYDSDCMEIEPPTKKPKPSNSASKVSEPGEDFDVMEVKAPTKKMKTSKKMKPSKIAPKASDLDEDSDVMEVAAPAQKAKVSKRATVAQRRKSTHESASPGRKVKSPTDVTNALRSNTKPYVLEDNVTPRPATRASTRKKVPRILRIGGWKKF